MANTQNQIKEVCKLLLTEFIRVCTTFNLRWWIDGGTLLGCMRNGKMIDWDDDIDIIMPRKDYDILHSLRRNFRENFFYQTAITDCCFEVHSKLRYNLSTSLTPREYSGQHNRGMFLDIFPLDNCPKDVAIIQDIHGFTKTFAKHTGYDKGVTKSSNFQFYNQVLRDISDLHEYSPYVANIAFWRYEKEPTILDRSWYNGTIFRDFEGIQVRCPAGAYEILKSWYGHDWLVPKQVPNCHQAFVNPTQPYQFYDGITEAEFKKLQKEYIDGYTNKNS